MNYVQSGFHLEHAGGCPETTGSEGEHLDVTCRECGFVWGMRTADG